MSTAASARSPIPLRGARPGNRAVLYLRQSKEKDDSESISTQEYLGQEYCRQRGYEVVAVLVDRVSGRKWDKRPGVIETMRLVESGDADVIVLWKWSRLSRSRLHWAVADDRVQLAGGRIESVTEPLDTTTASGRFARGVMTEYAAFQSESMGEVWRETLDRRRRAGLPGSGGERYGYLRDKAADTYAPHEQEAAVLREAYRRYIAGSGMASLARWLNDNGHLTKKGMLWHARTISRVLDSGFAAGLLHSDDGSYHPGAQEAIIDDETWAAYQARRAGTVKSPRGSARMASGLLRCSTCKATMYVSSSSGEKGYYTCSRSHRGDRTCSARTSITRTLVERYLAEWVMGLPEDEDLWKDALEREAAQRVRAIEDRAALARRIGQVERQLGELTIRLVDERHPISPAAYEAASAQLNDELQSLRARHLRAAPMPMTNLRELVQSTADGWLDLSPEGQNRALRRLLRRVEIKPPTRMGRGVWRHRFGPQPVWLPDPDSSDPS